MVETYFKSIYPDTPITQLDENEQYRFKIKHIKPEGHSYQIIFTDGLSSHQQPVKEGYEDYHFVELYFLLPDYWDLETEFWPVEWISRVGQVPQKNDTWFGPGDTIPAGYPPEILSDRFPANHFLLSEPIELSEQLSKPMDNGQEIKFLALIPICQPELDYKLRNSATVLLSRLKHKKHTEKVDLFRTSVCRKRFLGF